MRNVLEWRGKREEGGEVGEKGERDKMVVGRIYKGIS